LNFELKKSVLLTEDVRQINHKARIPIESL
jgi:hypothetical protein